MIEEALADLDDGDPDVEDELVAEGSIESDEYASPEEAALSIRNIALGSRPIKSVFSLPRSRHGHSISAPGRVA